MEALLVNENLLLSLSRFVLYLGLKLLLLDSMLISI